MIDVDHQISTVRRQLGTRVLEAGQARVQTISQSYPATLEDVWDACTNPERLPRWFLPVSGELRLGGKYQLEGNAGGTIESCDPPKSFGATWEFGGQVTWIEVRLHAESAEHTRLELDHIAHIEDGPNEFWEQFGPGATGVGWDSALIGLVLHLSTGEAVDPKAVEAWMGSADGIRFVNESANAWAETDIAEGTEPETARARAERTAAFYTPQPE
ncbi:SRPBCC family protein [Sciscionella sediminilitoris]|uniref:SRPBCC family protein n=1 Tax=Sciscionella sediminilitoris TaxID=1445613 RepID=UPI0004DF53CA|nr:SRPBCC family protein [Sciscionella sp. SE31]